MLAIHAKSRGGWPATTSMLASIHLISRQQLMSLDCDEVQSRRKCEYTHCAYPSISIYPHFQHDPPPTHTVSIVVLVIVIKVNVLVDVWLKLKQQSSGKVV